MIDSIGQIASILQIVMETINKVKTYRKIISISEHLPISSKPCWLSLANTNEPELPGKDSVSVSVFFLYREDLKMIKHFKTCSLKHVRKSYWKHCKFFVIKPE